MDDRRRLGAFPVWLLLLLLLMLRIVERYCCHPRWRDGATAALVVVLTRSNSSQYLFPHARIGPLLALDFSPPRAHAPRQDLVEAAFAPPLSKRVFYFWLVFNKR